MKRLAKNPNILSIPIEDSSHCTVLEKICTILLVLCPILQHYKGFFQDASTVIMILVFLYFSVKLLCTKQWKFGTVLPLILLSAFEIVNHGTYVLEIGREALLIAYYIAAASGALNIRYYEKTAINIAIAASGLIIVQYFCYYILGFHLQMVATSLLSEDAAQWILLAQTGRYSVSGKLMSFYRPSAFFLEPSHMTIYCFPALAIVLLSPNMSRNRIFTAILLSIGILMSTSGMGIAIVGGLWGVFLLRHLMGEGSFRDRIKNLLHPKTLVWLAAIAAVFVILYMGITPFRLSINRIFSGTTDGGKSAIEGRMGTGIKAIQDLSGWEFWFGKSDWGHVHEWNMSGLFYTLYTQGLVGTLISYGFYVKTLFKTKGAYFWIGVILMALSLFTVHTHAAFYMMFYVIILLNGYDLQNDGLVLRNRIYDKLTVCRRHR